MTDYFQVLDLTVNKLVNDFMKQLYTLKICALLKKCLQIAFSFCMLSLQIVGFFRIIKILMFNNFNSFMKLAFS